MKPRNIRLLTSDVVFKPQGCLNNQCEKMNTFRTCHSYVICMTRFDLLFSNRRIRLDVVDCFP